MSRILSDIQYVERLQKWLDIKIDFERDHSRLHKSFDWWEDLKGDCYCQLWKLRDKINEFYPEAYPASTVGFVNRIVLFQIRQKLKYETNQKRDYRKEIFIDDLRPVLDLNHIISGYSFDGPYIDYLVCDNGFEDRQLSNLVDVPELRKLLVWVGGLDIFEYYMYGEGDEPKYPHMEQVRYRLRKPGKQ